MSIFFNWFPRHFFFNSSKTWGSHSNLSQDSIENFSLEILIFLIPLVSAGISSELLRESLRGFLIDCLRISSNETSTNFFTDAFSNSIEKIVPDYFFWLFLQTEMLLKITQEFFFLFKNIYWGLSSFQMYLQKFEQIFDKEISSNKSFKNISKNSLRHPNKEFPKCCFIYSSMNFCWTIFYRNSYFTAFLDNTNIKKSVLKNLKLV